MNDNLIAIDIVDEQTLLKACDLLHDAKFDKSDMQIDRDAGVLTAIFEREFFEDPDLMQHERKWWFFIKTTFPIAKTQLTLRDISSIKEEDKSKIGKYMFNECKMKNNIATLWFCEDMKIIVEFNDKPRGKFADIELLDKTGNMLTTGVKEFKEKC